MNRFALTGALALGLTLAACNNEPEEETGSSDDSVAPAENDTVDGDEIVGEGPSDDATPYAGKTGGSNASSGGSSGSGTGAVSSGNGGNAGGASRTIPGTGGEDGVVSGSSGGTASTMTKGGSDTAGTRPPKGSKLQKADPR